MLFGKLTIKKKTSAVAEHKNETGDRSQTASDFYKSFNGKIAIQTI